jgi:inosine-uridine nucleoside N-ribohydrolase
MAQKIPIILDTDIGTDIDDVWALAMMLKSPELDIKLIVSTTGDTVRRAALTAKLLEVAGRTDIAVGIGIPGGEFPLCHEGWTGNYDMSSYSGKVYSDGVSAIIETIMISPQPITLIGIGPATNLASALEREPRIASKVRLVGMFGSVRIGYNGNPSPDVEYNVVKDVPACRKVFTASWDMTITPVDTCGLVRLTGEKYQKILHCPDPLIQAVIENYRYWCEHVKNQDYETQSSVLFDTVAIYLAFSERLLNMETIKLEVTDNGFTVVQDQGKAIRCAITWKDLAGFENFLVARLTGGNQ